MSNIVQFASGQFIVAANNTGYTTTSDSRIVNSTTESSYQLTMRSGGVVSLLYARVVTNTVTATSTLRTRLNAANGSLSVSIPLSTTGEFEDTANTDTVAAGDEINYQVVAGATGTSIVTAIISTVFTATTDTVKKYYGGNSANFSAASTTLYSTITGDAAMGATEANAQYKIKFNGTQKNFFVNVRSNARTSTTTFGNRVGGVNGALVVSVTSTATGFFEDTTHTDSVVVDNLLNYYSTTGTGTAQLLATVGSEIVTTDNTFHIMEASVTGPSQGPSETKYWTIGGYGGSNSTTEANQQAKARIAFTASFLACFVSVNSVGASTMHLRQNTANTALTLSIGASTTGYFEDATHSVSIVASDEINYRLVTGAGGSLITLNSIGILATIASAAVTPTYIIYRPPWIS